MSMAKDLELAHNFSSYDASMKMKMKMRMKMKMKGFAFNECVRDFEIFSCMRMYTMDEKLFLSQV
jgi:hypothetical protein